MTAEQIVQFLEALQVRKIRIKDNGWVEACCPLAKWFHTRQTDHHPSFGVSINDAGKSVFSCFSCKSGSLEELLQTLELYEKGQTGQYQWNICHELLQGEKVVFLPPYQEPGHLPDAVFQEWPSYWLEHFISVHFFEKAMAYLGKRRVPPEVIRHFNLRFDGQKERIVCPYHTVYGKLAGARGRSIREGGEGPRKHFDYTCQGKNNCRFVWYNEPALNLSGPVVVVEGQFDVWRVWKAYPKVLGSLSAKPTWEKLKKLQECPFVIHIPDNPKIDKAGEESMLYYAKQCHKLKLKYRVLLLGDGVKDPDDCCSEYLSDRIRELL